MNRLYRFFRTLFLAVPSGLLVACGGGGGGASVVQETLHNFTNGQSGLVVNASPATTTTLGFIGGNGAVGPDGRYYFPANNKILVFSSISAGDMQTPIATIEGWTPQNMGDVATFSQISAVVFNGQQIIVSDTANNRVLIWNDFKKLFENSMQPDVFIGQTSLSGTLGDCGTGNLNLPMGVTVISNKLAIADYNNNRVLVFPNALNGDNTSNTDNPVVLGDPNFACTSPDLTATPQPILPDSTLGPLWPSDVVSDGTHLVVADYGFNRLLVWKASNLFTAAPPDMLLGKSLARDNSVYPPSGTLTNAALYSPTSLAMRSGRLAVLDKGYNRVLVWNTLPTCDTTATCQAQFGTPVVLGQINLSVPVPDTTIISGNASGLTFTGLNQLVVSTSDNNHINSSLTVFNATAP